MRTVGRDSIVEFKLHTQRMINSISHINFQGNTTEEAERVQTELSAFKDPIQFENRLRPLLKKGLQAYYELVDETTDTEHPSEAKVSVVLTYSFEVRSSN